MAAITNKPFPTTTNLINTPRLPVGVVQSTTKSLSGILGISNPTWSSAYLNSSSTSTNWASNLSTTLNPNDTKTATNATHSSTFLYYGSGFVVPMCIILSVVILLTVGGNLMVILTIIKHKTMRTRTNMFIVSLAVADILAAICVMPFAIVTLIMGDWVFGTVACEFNSVAASLFLTASVQTLMFISIHKCISITRPFSRFMTPRRILVMIAVTWIWSTAYAVGGAAGWTINMYKKGASQCGPTYPSNITQLTHSVVNTLLNLVIPIGVTFFCYSRVFYEIRKHMSRMRENTNIDVNSSWSQQKRISVTLLLVMIIFVMCWTPYIFYSCFAAFAKDKSKIWLKGNPLAYWCGYINSACNPVIYAFRSPSFRQGYYSLICGEQKQLQSGGSFSQRSPSFRKRSLRGTGISGSNGDSLPRSGRSITNPNHKQRAKRLVSTNSWASISFSVPYHKANKKGILERQKSVDIEATSRPLLQRSVSCDSAPSPTSPSVISNGTVCSLVPDSPCMAFAETSLTILAPISEGSIEDLALNVQMVTNDQDDHQVAMNNERNKCMMDSSLEKVAEISRAITLVACNDMEIPTDGHGNVDSKTSEDQNGILI